MLCKFQLRKYPVQYLLSLVNNRMIMNKKAKLHIDHKTLSNIFIWCNIDYTMSRIEEWRIHQIRHFEPSRDSAVLARRRWEILGIKQMFCFFWYLPNLFYDFLNNVHKYELVFESSFRMGGATHHFGPGSVCWQLALKTNVERTISSFGGQTLRIYYAIILTMKRSLLDSWTLFESVI